MLLCITFLSQCMILGLNFWKLSNCFNAHNSDLLLCIYQHFFSRCPCIVYVCNSLCFNFINNYLLETFCFGDKYRSLLFCLDFLNLHLSLSLDFSLLFVNLGSFYLLMELIHFSFIVSLKGCQLLLLLIFNSQPLVFLIFNVVLKSILYNCLLLECVT